MPRLEDLQVFVRTADCGSLSAAARELDLTPAVASAALKRLEAELGALLLARSTRSLRLTVDGERYLEHARAALASLAAGSEAIAAGREKIGGTLTLSAPSDFGRTLLLPWLNQFQEAHPALELQLRISDRLADMYRQSVDVALRYGVPGDSSLVALPLSPENPRVLCAAPGYFARHGMPATPADLRRHNCLRLVLGDAVHSRWSFSTTSGETLSVVVNGRHTSDDGEVVRRWAVEGLGIAYKSRLDVLADLRAGRLQAALTNYENEVSPLYMVCAHRLSLSAAVVRLREFLQERLGAYASE
ncbi:MAG TPA: LysR family transcriptional regulator [Paucimonas sp.]|nr:LysR family transcriptional regulator [Paucimonas sp.]